MRASFLAMLMLTALASAAVHADDPATVKAILVTGASTGIGRSALERTGSRDASPTARSTNSRTR